MFDEKVNARQREIYEEIQRKQSKIVRRIDVVEHAKIVRRELKEKFPEIKFRVRSDRFAGGDSVTAYHVGEITKEQQREVIEFVRKFNGFAGDLMDGRYNVGFMYNDERIAGATFCRYNHRYPWAK